MVGEVVVDFKNVDAEKEMFMGEAIEIDMFHRSQQRHVAIHSPT